MMGEVEFHQLNVTSWEERQNGTLSSLYSSHYEALQHTVRTYITPGLCLFGIIGNIVNLVVLTRVRLYKTESRKERGANTGLVALAISDMLFCIAVFPVAFTDHGQVVFPAKSFLLYYQVYGTGVVTTFILTSTWITVTLSVLRYVTISHPTTPVALCNPCSVKAIYICVCVIVASINLPTFLQYQVSEIGYVNNRSLYFIDISIMDGQIHFTQPFQLIRFIIFIALPAAILLFCNCSLVWALHVSIKVRKQYHVARYSQSRQNRITLLLVIIAIGFIVLVFPSELMDFFMDYVRRDQSRTELFLVLRVLTNTLQMINFSCNFLLYCALNVHFRSVLKDIILLRRPKSTQLLYSMSYRRDTVERKRSSVRQGPPEDVPKTISLEKERERERERRNERDWSARRCIYPKEEEYKRTWTMGPQNFDLKDQTLEMAVLQCPMLDA